MNTASTGVRSTHYSYEIKPNPSPRHPHPHPHKIEMKKNTWMIPANVDQLLAEHYAINIVLHQNKVERGDPALLLRQVRGHSNWRMGLPALLPLDYLPLTLQYVWCSTGPFRFRWLNEYIYSSCIIIIKSDVSTLLIVAICAVVACLRLFC